MVNKVRNFLAQKDVLVKANLEFLMQKDVIYSWVNKKQFAPKKDSAVKSFLGQRPGLVKVTKFEMVENPSTGQGSHSIAFVATQTIEKAWSHYTNTNGSKQSDLTVTVAQWQEFCTKVFTPTTDNKAKDIKGKARRFFINCLQLPLMSSQSLTIRPIT